MSSPSRRRSRRSPVSPWSGAALALGVVTLGLGGLSVWGLADPSGAGKGLLPLAAAHEARADALLKSGDYRRAGREATLALALGPARAVDWLQLAYADAAEHGRLTKVGLDALEKAYVFQPLGPEISEWRMRFALDHWSELTPALRRQVREEAQSLWPTAGRRRVERAMTSGHTPQARAVGALMLIQLRSVK